MFLDNFKTVKKSVTTICDSTLTQLLSNFAIGQDQTNNLLIKKQYKNIIYMSSKNSTEFLV